MLCRCPLPHLLVVAIAIGFTAAMDAEAVPTIVMDVQGELVFCPAVDPCVAPNRRG